MNLTEQQKAIGKENFDDAVAITRRDFLTGTVAAGLASGAGLGSIYFGYGKSVGDPLRVGVLGTGDEGSVLVGAHNPDYLNVVAIADIRPYNVFRAFHGDVSSPSAYQARPGLMAKYKWSTEDAAREKVKIYAAYEDLLADPNVEAVIIALPLHLHAEASIKAMRAGKHVLTEKLMGHSVHECKEMGRVSQETGRILATGHQRHYSMLYDNAVHTIGTAKLIGDLHSIRAQWHRGNLPGKDSWKPAMPDDASLAKQLAGWKKDLETAKPSDIDPLEKKIAQLEAQISDSLLDAAKFGYTQMSLPDGSARTPMEELVRWRLWNRTGGGLMAEDCGVKVGAGRKRRRVAELAEDVAQHGIGEGIGFHTAGRGDEQGAVNVEDDRAEGCGRSGGGLKRREEKVKRSGAKVGGEDFSGG